MYNDLTSNFILFLKNVLEKNQNILPKHISIQESGLRSTTIWSNTNIQEFPNHLYIRSDIDKRDLFIFYNPQAEFIEKILESNKSKGAANKTFYYILKIDTIKIGENLKDEEESYCSLQFDEKDMICKIPSHLDQFWFNVDSHFIVNELFYINEKLIENIVDAILSWYNNTRVNELDRDAISFYHSMKYTDVLDCLNKIIEVYDNNDHLISEIGKLRLIVAFNNKGLCFIKLGKFDEAIKSFNKSFDIDPDIDSIFIKKIVSFLVKMGRETEALDLYDKIIEKNPKYYSYKDKGDLLVKMGRGAEVLCCMIPYSKYI